MSKCRSKCASSIAASGVELRDAGIGEQNVDAAEPLFDLRVESVEIGEFGDVALHADGVGADFRDGGVKLRLSAPRDDDLRAFLRKQLGRRKPDAAVAARDNGDFSGKLSH